MKTVKEIKVKVQFSPGYQQRYTEACLNQLKKREMNRKVKEDSPKTA